MFKPLVLAGMITILNATPALPSSNYPEAIEQAYVKGCVPHMSYNVCLCTIRMLASQYDLTRFLEAALLYARDRVVNEVLVVAVQDSLVCSQRYPRGIDLD